MTAGILVVLYLAFFLIERIAPLRQARAPLSGRLLVNAGVSIAAFATAGVGAYLAARYLLDAPESASRWALVAVLLIGGVPLIAGLVLFGLIAWFVTWIR